MLAHAIEHNDDSWIGQANRWNNDLQQYRALMGQADKSWCAECLDPMDIFKDGEKDQWFEETIQAASPLLREFLEWDRQFSPELFKLIFKTKK